MSADTVIVEIEKKVTCIGRITLEVEDATKYFIRVEDEDGDTMDIQGQEAFDTFPVGSGLKFCASLSYFDDEDDGPAVDPR